MVTVKNIFMNSVRSTLVYLRSSKMTINILNPAKTKISFLSKLNNYVAA